MSSLSLPEIRIEAKDLVVAYGNNVALNIGELVAKGGIIALVGHNGSGKSTMIKAVLELLPLRKGHLRVLGVNVDEGDIADKTLSKQLVPEQDMAFSPEQGAVFADISVESYVKLWCRLKKNDADYYKGQEGSSIIERLSVGKFFPKLGRELSKGERRKVQTAIGFLTHPRLFLLDEPFDGLDVARTEEFALLIKEESKKRSFIISSHRMDIVERLADCIVVLSLGSLAAVGTTEEVSTALAGKTISLSCTSLTTEDVKIFSRELESLLPNAVVNCIGHQMLVTGPGGIEEVIRSRAREKGIHEYTLSQATPSLTDAMTYHLKGMDISERI